jgi:hypothetical protein
VTDHIAVLQGFTRDMIIETPTECIIALVRPDTNFTGLYRAWDTDMQEFVKISGRCARWNMAYGDRYK